MLTNNKDYNKMITKTQISKRILKKRNPEIVETIELAKKNDLLDLAKRLSGPVRLYKSVNLDELDDVKGDKIMIVGKVLGSGEVGKKIDISALGFSDNAREKLKKAGCKVNSIKEEIKNNNKLEGVEII